MIPGHLLAEEPWTSHCVSGSQIPYRQSNEGKPRSLGPLSPQFSFSATKARTLSFGRSCRSLGGAGRRWSVWLVCEVWGRMKPRFSVVLFAALHLLKLEMPGLSHWMCFISSLRSLLKGTHSVSVMTPKFISPAWAPPLNSRSVNPSASYSHLRPNMSRTDFPQTQLLLQYSLY